MLKTKLTLHANSTISISGNTMFDARVHSIRACTDSKKIEMELRLSQILIQADVYITEVKKQVWEDALKLTRESIIRVSGPLTSCNPHGNSEETKHTGTKCQRICICDLEIIALACQDIWADKQKSVSLEDRLDNRILDVRHTATGAIFKLHSGMCQLMVEFLCSNGFHWIHTPRIIKATVAGDNEYFGLPYFGENAWLAQSTQHHKQMALSMDMERVFEIGPVFRSEIQSLASSRHLTEFTVLDIGMVFKEDYHEVVEMIESMLLFVMRGLQERKQYRPLIETVKKLYPSAKEFKIGLDENGKVPRVTFLEAKRILREELKLETNDSRNFTQQEEAILGNYFRKSSRAGGTDIFTIDQYPSSMRQFNSKANKQDPEFSNTWDTIVRGREICSGSQRINSYDELCKAMRAGVCGPPLNPDAEEWKPYLTAFKTGMPRHGGCGLGVNRLLQGFLGLNDVREVTMFPRDGKRLAP